MFAFGTDALIPSLLSSLFLSFAQKLVVESFPINNQFVEVLLEPAKSAGRHTSIIHIKRKDENILDPVKYMWAQYEMQPWGTPILVQCPGCKSFRPWGPRRKASDNSTAEFRCRAMTIDSARCNFVLHVPKPPNVVRAVKDWLIVSWP